LRATITRRIRETRKHNYKAEGSDSAGEEKAQSTRARERARTFQILITGGTKTRTKRRKVTIVDWSSKQKKKTSGFTF